MKEITSPQEFDEIINWWERICIYKFNPDNCSLSTRTKLAVEEAEHTYNLPTYRINVQTSIELKLHVAHIAGIEHESPQCILFDKKEAIAKASMMHISQEWFSEILT